MLLGVVSDTHGHVANTQAAIRILETFHPAAVIHCGDIGSTEIARMFTAWPTHFVLGNVDYDASDLEAAIRAMGQHFHGAFGELALAERRIAFLHGHDERRLRQETASGRWDLLCHGHTHVRETKQEGTTLVVNPGALYRATPHSLAIIELDTLQVHHVVV